MRYIITYIFFTFFLPAALPAHANETISRLYIPTSNQTTILKENGEQRLLTKDYLSSTRVVEANGTSQSTQMYYPYGNSVERKEISTDKQFTGHRSLDGAGVYHADARFYNPEFGSFIQADRIEGPNRYAYVRGNPVSFNDPSGNEQQLAYARPENGAQAGSDTTNLVQNNFATLPRFDLMWLTYPHGNAEEVKKNIGGQVNADWITNTCTIRMCSTLNRSGFEVPQNYEYRDEEGRVNTLNTVRGRDDKNYAIRVSEFIPYMYETFGPPTIVYENPGDGGPVPEEIKGIKGIIVFDVNIWSDATGHADLWDGQQVAHGDYFSEAKTIYLWEAPKAWEVVEQYNINDVLDAMDRDELKRQNKAL